MAAGNTTTGSLQQSLPVVIDAARNKREYEAVWSRCCDKHTLPEGTGTAWNEVTLDQLTAQGGISETTILDNPQQITDSLFSLTPVVSGLTTFITDRVQRRIDKKAYARIGRLANEAVARKKDEDYLTTIDGASLFSQPGAGSTLTSGHISAAVAQIKRGAATSVDRLTGDIMIPLHSFQIKDIQDEIVAGVGTYTLPTGMTQDVFEKGFYMGSLFGGSVMWAGNISVDSATDVKGGVHFREAIVAVQGHSPRAETVRHPEIGGGGDALYYYDEYVFGERAAGNGLAEIYSDATAPTS